MLSGFSTLRATMPIDQMCFNGAAATKNCDSYNVDPNGGGASRKAIASSCEQSLRRLQSDIDLYWMHAWDE